MQSLLNEWQVEHRFTCAYRPQGNGICERNHRTIKTAVARSGSSVEEAVFWYNATRGERRVAPFVWMFGATPRIPGIQQHRMDADRPQETEQSDEEEDQLDNPFSAGEKVYLRRNGRCDEPWSGPHVITGVRSPVAVELDNDGITRHVSHIRRVPTTVRVLTEVSASSDEESSTDEIAERTSSEVPASSDDGSSSGSEEVPEPEERRPVRARRWPARLQDYISAASTTGGGVISKCGAFAHKYLPHAGTTW